MADGDIVDVEVPVVIVVGQPEANAGLLRDELTDVERLSEHDLLVVVDPESRPAGAAVARDLEHVLEIAVVEVIVELEGGRDGAGEIDLALDGRVEPTVGIELDAAAAPDRALVDFHRDVASGRRTVVAPLDPGVGGPVRVAVAVGVGDGREGVEEPQLVGGCAAIQALRNVEIAVITHSGIDYRHGNVTADGEVPGRAWSRQVCRLLG